MGKPRELPLGAGWWAVTGAMTAHKQDISQVTMSRAPANFRQKDVTRAVKAMIAVGVDVERIRVEISKAGSIIVTVNASADRDDDREGNEWDRV